MSDPHVKIEVEDRKDPSKWVSIDSWEEYSISLSVFNPCDNFSLSPIPTQYAKFMAGNQKCRIWVDGHLRFTGITDERTSEVNEDDRNLSLTGRCMASIPYDSTAEPGSLGSQTLADLAANQLAPWMPDWIPTIVLDNAPSFYRLIGKKGSYKTTKVVEYDPVTGKDVEKVTGRTWLSGVKGGKSSPEYRGVDQDRLRDTYLDGSQKIWAALEAHAKRVACTMWSTVDGSFFIGRPRYDEFVHEPTLAFNNRGTGNVRRASFRASTAERFSDWKFTAQGRPEKTSKGLAAINHKVRVRDPGEAFHTLQPDGSLRRRFYRPTTISVDRGCQDVKLLRRLARTSMEQSLVQTFDYTMVVEGHGWPNTTTTAPLWAHDCCVDVKDEIHDISGAHYVHTVDLTRSKDRGVETRIKLIPSGIWMALDHDTVDDTEYEEYMIFKAWW